MPTGEWNRPVDALPEPGTQIEAELSNGGVDRGRVTNLASPSTGKVCFKPENYRNQKDEHGYYIGRNYTKYIRWRYTYVDTLPTSAPTDKEGAKKLFQPTTVKAKGGYRAQVTFNYTVVWEADTVYADDEGYQEGKQGAVSGQDKAQKAAASAVDQAVETLFAKVKV